MGIADEMTLSVLGLRTRSAHNFARSAHSEFASTVTLLEAKGRDKNRREGGNERCRQSDIVGFGNARNGARVLCCLRRAHSKPGEHCYLARSVGAR